MCGIAGLVNKNNEIIDADELMRMCDAIPHRGPDGKGHYVDGVVGLGHRRLAILDISEGGAQPMLSKNKKIVVSYNGEIYNYIELRQTLEKLGYCFHTDCDTEVLLVAYEAWGTECVSRFNGMWSFAIYDKNKDILFCSRDRFGIKPFYYLETPEHFAFASEIRQLLGLQTVVSAERSVVLDFLLTGMSDSNELTFFQGIKKLIPGHNLVYNLKKHSIILNQYYDIQIQEELVDVSNNNASNIYRNVLEESVKLRLRSDVSVGTCLSGGLDSSSVALLAAQNYDSETPFCAITASSEQASNDETNYARLVAKHANMNWVTVKPKYEDFVEVLEDVVRAQEEPFGSPSIIMQYHVMKEAKKSGVTVLLDGQGGDETLLGYERYYAACLVDSFRNKGILDSIKFLRDASESNEKVTFFWIMSFVFWGAFAPVRYFFYRRRHRYLKQTSLPNHIRLFAKHFLDVKSLQKLEITQTNLPALLRYADKNSMSQSIEVRLPFLDFKTVETALSLPIRCKINQGWTKWVLRKSMEDILPEAVCWRKNKFGFEAPESMWLSEHAQAMEATVMESHLVEKLCDRELLSSCYNGLDLRSKWRLYSVALWEKEFKVSV